jgi:hypothetical protein
MIKIRLNVSAATVRFHRQRGSVRLVRTCRPPARSRRARTSVCASTTRARPVPEPGRRQRQFLGKRKRLAATMSANPFDFLVVGARNHRNRLASSSRWMSCPSQFGPRALPPGENRRGNMLGTWESDRGYPGSVGVEVQYLRRAPGFVSLVRKAVAEVGGMKAAGTGGDGRSGRMSS